jgi:hypothetical protein
MRRTAQMRWIEEAEARRVWLYDAESKPPAAESLAGPEVLLTRKPTVTVLVARMTGRMTGRLARAARGRGSAGAKDAPAEGCDAVSVRVGTVYRGPYLVAGTSSAGTAAAAGFSR